MAKQDHSAGALLEKLRDLSEDADTITLDDLLGIVGDRSHGPWLLLPALIGITPVASIPGVPTVLAALIALIAVQIAWGREHLWLPDAVENRELDADKVAGTVRKLEPVAGFLDKLFPGKLSFMVSRPFVRIGAVLTLFLCATVPPLELVPFAGAVSFGAIALFGLALFVKDGILMLLAMGASLAAVYFVGDLLW